MYILKKITTCTYIHITQTKSPYKLYTGFHFINLKYQNTSVAIEWGNAVTSAPLPAIDK